MCRLWCRPQPRTIPNVLQFHLSCKLRHLWTIPPTNANPQQDASCEVPYPHQPNHGCPCCYSNGWVIPVWFLHRHHSQNPQQIAPSRQVLPVLLQLLLLTVCGNSRPAQREFVIVQNHRQPNGNASRLLPNPRQPHNGHVSKSLYHDTAPALSWILRLSCAQVASCKRENHRQLYKLSVLIWFQGPHTI